MSGSIIGGRKAAQTNKEKYGEDFYVRIGSRGGKNGRGHKFGHGKVDPSIIGKIGGKISRKPKKGQV